MGTKGAWAGVRRHLAARPWTVKVYVASVLVSPVVALMPDVTYEPSSESLLHALLLLGVWVGDRVAWGLTVALLSVGFLMGLVAASGATMLLFLGILAVWIGLLVAAPTQRWVFRDRSRPGPAQASTSAVGSGGSSAWSGGPGRSRCGSTSAYR